MLCIIRFIMSRSDLITVSIFLYMAIMLSGTVVKPAQAGTPQQDPAGAFNFPLMRDNGGHMRKLVENCFSMCGRRPA